MSFLLMIFLTIVCLVPTWPAPMGHDSPTSSAAATALVVLVVAGHAFFISRRFIWRLTDNPHLRDHLLNRYDRARSFQQILQLVLFVLALSVLGWGWAVRNWRPSGPDQSGVEVLTLLPFVLMQLVTWLFYYDADRAAHRAGRLQDATSDVLTPAWLESRQSQAHPAPQDGRWAYALFQARQKLALVFIPVLLLIVQKEVGRLLPGWLRNWQVGVSALSVFLLGSVFLCMPLIIRVLLGLRPLPPGRIRDRLLLAAKRLNFRTTDILLWNTRRGMANALVIGLVPWLRYVVFTDRMLEEFTEDEIEAVFGHEVGHVHHRHMLYYLCFLIISLSLLGLVTETFFPPLVKLLPLPADMVEALDGELMVVPAVMLMAVYLLVVFGFLSRRCERQADVFGCRAVSCSDPYCRGHDETTVLPAGGQGLCVTGVQTFIRALDKVAAVNNISREHPGYLQAWQHSTIAKRVRFLDRIIIDRGVEGRFQIRLFWIKVGLLGILTTALGMMVAIFGWRW